MRRSGRRSKCTCRAVCSPRMPTWAHSSPRARSSRLASAPLAAQEAVEVIPASIGGRNCDARVLDRRAGYGLANEALQNLLSLKKLCGPQSIRFGFDEFEELVEPVVHNPL